MTTQLVGILGSGLIGYDAFDRRCWSGSSYYVFTELAQREMLHRAFGVEVSRPQRLALMLRHYHPNRNLWRSHYYMSRAYRNGLTRAVERRLRPSDFEFDFLQLGALYDVPRLVQGRALCFSYNDGNLAQNLKSPYAPQSVSTRRIDEGLKFERTVNQGLDRIFVMSDYLKRSFVNEYGISADRVSNVGAGVNLDAIPAPASRKLYDRQDIIFIGIDFPRKGGPQLLEAFRQVKRVHPRAVLHIVGPTRLDITPELESGVQFHGYLNKSIPEDWTKLKNLFERCSLFVMPSLYEPFGIAPLEAMLHQIPAVVSRAWALEEIVEDGVTGTHVEPGSVEDLVDRIATLLSDPAALERMGEAARDKVLREYTWPHVISRMVDEIQAVQQSRRVPAFSQRQAPGYSLASDNQQGR